MLWIHALQTLTLLRAARTCLSVCAVRDTTDPGEPNASRVLLARKFDLFVCIPDIQAAVTRVVDDVSILVHNEDSSGV